MASWCPQQEVLNHPAVGAFLTHSGWNSALESICAGMPILSWPFFADHQTNCRYQCNEWGVGMEIDSNVQRDVVSALIAELMEGEKGKAMRKRAEEWREKAVMAARTGRVGSLQLRRASSRCAAGQALDFDCDCLLHMFPLDVFPCNVGVPDCLLHMFPLDDCSCNLPGFHCGMLPICHTFTTERSTFDGMDVLIRPKSFLHVSLVKG
jgi:hypothetical protein